MRHLILIPVASLLTASAVQAQKGARDHGKHEAPDPVEHGAHDAMASRDGHGHAASSAHLRFSPSRRATAADSARARAILDNLRRAIARYEDTTAAVKDGFRMFAPGVKRQPVYHFTKGRNARRNENGFDPERPTSLLYERGANGKFRLVGAMYTAPRRSRPDDLDARVPIGIARWHMHTNVCVPKRGEKQRWREMRGKRMKFGPAGAIATKADCDVAGGKFHEEILNWMVHVNTSQGRDLRVAFGDKH